MKAYTRRRLVASVKLGVAAVPLFVGLRLAHGFGIVPGTFVMGFGGGFAVGVAELFLLRNWFRGLPFLLHLAVKSLAIVLVMYLTFAVLNLLDVLIEGISWQAYAQALSNRQAVVGLVEAFSVIAFLLFFVQLDRLLGPGLLLGYVTGRYHRPRQEPRVFMFLPILTVNPAGPCLLARTQLPNLLIRAEQVGSTCSLPWSIGRSGCSASPLYRTS